MNKKTLVITGVHTIVTHQMPHVDEVAGIVLLRQYGEEKFPGIKKAKFVFWDAGSRPHDKKNWMDHAKEGRLLVGIGGGCFDEHPNENTDRAKSHCAATLIAEYLGIDKKPEVQQLLKYTLNNDTNGGTNPFDLGALINLGNKTWWDTDPQAIFSWAMQPIEWHLLKQRKFFIETKKEFDTYANIIPIVYKGRTIKIVAIESNDTEIGAYARSEHGTSAAIVIQKNEKGQIAITSQKRAAINFDEVIVHLRKKEAQIKRLPFQGLDLSVDGTLPEIDNWYYDKPAGRILNGSLSAPNVTATRIYFNCIIDIVCETLENVSKN